MCSGLCYAAVCDSFSYSYTLLLCCYCCFICCSTPKFINPVHTTSASDSWFEVNLLVLQLLLPLLVHRHAYLASSVRYPQSLSHSKVIHSNRPSFCENHLAIHKYRNHHSHPIHCLVSHVDYPVRRRPYSLDVVKSVAQATALALPNDV